MKRTQPDKAFLMEALVVGTPAAIINQEKQGQQELCKPGTKVDFPIDIHYSHSYGEGQSILESWGIKFEKHEDIKDIFMTAYLPEGWSIVPTDHSMWSKLKDNNDRVRASIFFKAAFYDYNAHAHVESRFSFSARAEDQLSSAYFGIITDGGKEVWRGKLHPDTNRQGYKQAQEEAEKLLTSLYPDYRDPRKYWDIEPKFPASESEQKKGEWYGYSATYYHHNGSFADSGGNRQYCLAETAEEATRKIFEHFSKGSTSSLYIIEIHVLDSSGKSIASKKIGEPEEPEEVDIEFDGNGGYYEVERMKDGRTRRKRKDSRW